MKCGHFSCVCLSEKDEIINHRRRKHGVEGGGRPPSFFGLSKSVESKSGVKYTGFCEGRCCCPPNSNHLPTPVLMATVFHIFPQVGKMTVCPVDWAGFVQLLMCQNEYFSLISIIVTISILGASTGKYIIINSLNLNHLLIRCRGYLNPLFSSLFIIKPLKRGCMAFMWSNKLILNINFFFAIITTGKGSSIILNTLTELTCAIKQFSKEI